MNMNAAIKKIDTISVVLSGAFVLLLTFVSHHIGVVPLWIRLGRRLPLDESS